jgi:serine/threonine-protein kinase
VRNVVPVIDHGETDEHFVLVMPRARMSLRDRILHAGPALAAEEVREILTQIATTLEDIQERVVHRDIKPENVLLLDDCWCLSDFGISRYAEKSTAPDTRKHALTAQYAAPEQWRGERAKPPADVYALGVIGYELLAGSWPFPGPDFRDQHLHGDPPPLKHDDRALVSLIADCLSKAPEARPRPAQLLQRLGRPPVAQGAGLAALQQASSAHAQRAAQSARQRSQEQSAKERRTELFQSGAKKLAALLDHFIGELMGAASEITLSERADGARSLCLSRAELHIGPVCQTTGDEFGPRVRFEVAAFGTIATRHRRTQAATQDARIRCGSATPSRRATTRGLRRRSPVTR